VESGVTVGVLAEVSVAAELAAGRLVALPWVGPALRLTTYLVLAKRRWVSPAKAALHDATSHIFPAAGSNVTAVEPSLVGHQ
jgi:DNA-binding transcriptional LysR family regulator